MRRVEFTRVLFEQLIATLPPDPARPRDFKDITEWAQVHLFAAVDLLGKWFATGDRVLAELFEGWVRSRMVADLFEGGPPAGYQPAEVIRRAAAAWVALLPPETPAGAAAVLADDLAATVTRLATPLTRRLKVLFIGDCLQFEVITALLGPCARAGIEVCPTLLTDKVPALLRNRLRALPPDGHQLIFFSPFSHALFAEYAALLKPTAALWSAGTGAGLLVRLLEEVRATVQLLAERFECPVYVHNTAGAVQLTGLWSGAVKYLGSWFTRRWVRREVNAAVTRWLADAQVNPGGRAQLLDEDALRHAGGTAVLGREYLHVGPYHPTRLGVQLGSGPYFDAVYAAAQLATKKVVVCDLDNTLWDGVIGEGPVTHHLDRQGVLKELRRRGVLLSIASKNDPANVKWTGADLVADDFVAPQINWGPKPVSVARIRDELNLKVKDFVFLDDRPDELERVRAAFPEVHALDATRPETWRALGHWQRMLPAHPDEDRTRLYHERVLRDGFLNSRAAGGPVEDETAALPGLELTVTIRTAARGDLPRVVELINRTNQFNLCGSRTTLRELRDHLAARGVVVLADAGDKFGRMGVVGVMVVDLHPDRAEVPMFVLSCRVFGFGIEYALLNALRRVAPPDCRLVGHYRETQANEPCRQMYPRAGLRWDGHSWVGAVAELQPDPTWLTVRHELANVPESGRRPTADRV
jgi:FkbH-like protein